jgi:hypothetical protein
MKNLSLNFKMRYAALMITFVISCVNCIHAQLEKNNIYLFDCTGSMQTNNLWQPAKDALHSTISTQSKILGSEFTVIPFGDNPYSTISFSSREFNDKKKEIENNFEKYIKQSKYTNISDVLSAGFNKIDNNKENKIYLLTDGLPNHNDSPEKVANTIEKWCGNHRNCRFFYVALTNNVINPIIKHAIDNCDDAFIVQCENKVIPQIADISSNVYTNLEELNNVKPIDFSIPGEYGLSISSNDQLFDVKIEGGKASNGKIALEIAPRNDLDTEELHQQLQGGDHLFTVDIRCTDPNYFIANPTLTIHVADKVKSELKIANGEEQIKAQEVEWYDSFWWSKADADKKAEWNLSAIFKHELPSSAVKFKIEADGSNADDYTAWYNGEPLEADNTFTVNPGKPSVLQVQFNHDAKTGKRYFNLIPIKFNAVDMVNDSPREEYPGTSLRTKYSIVWNPLKTAVVWTLLIILALLVLWLCILKHFFFPTIKVARIQITGPSSYYVTKKMKGARRVVLTSKKKSQSVFSRIMTGEIKYVRADHFEPEITIEPAGGKKRVKLRTLEVGDNGWDIYPSNIFKKGEDGTITNRTTKDISEIKFE